MEELHRIHKEVPFGYWTMWLEPALKALAARWRSFKAAQPAHNHAVTLL